MTIKLQKTFADSNSDIDFPSETFSNSYSSRFTFSMYPTHQKHRENFCSFLKLQITQNLFNFYPLFFILLPNTSFGLDYYFIAVGAKCNSLFVV